MNKSQKILLGLTVSLLTIGGILASIPENDSHPLFTIGSLGVIFGIIAFVGLVVSLVVSSVRNK